MCEALCGIQNDGVTFEGKMGKLFIKYSAFYPHPWVVCEMLTHQLICPTPSSVLNYAGNEENVLGFSSAWCGRVGYPGLFSGIAFELLGDYS